MKKNRNAEVSDTTTDAKSTAACPIKKLIVILTIYKIFLTNSSYLLLYT
ncbi:MAG TPA: hypothetical protein VH396_16260 [Chitinophagaceae bacterium]